MIMYDRPVVKNSLIKVIIVLFIALALSIFLTCCCIFQIIQLSYQVSQLNKKNVELQIHIDYFEKYSQDLQIQVDSNKKHSN